MPSTVEAIANGETCDDRDPEAIRLFNFGGDESYTIVDGGSSIVEIMQDSTMTSSSRRRILLATPASSSTPSTTVVTTLERVARPAGCPQLQEGLRRDLPGHRNLDGGIYYTMSSGTMSGTGRYAGSEFALTTNRFNEYYGLQIGEGANKNENYGASAWFFWTGEYVLDGASQARWPPAVTSSSTSIAASAGRSTTTTMAWTTAATATDSATPTSVRVSSAPAPTARSSGWPYPGRHHGRHEQPEGSDPHHGPAAEPTSDISTLRIRGVQQHAPAHRPVHHERWLRGRVVRRATPARMSSTCSTSTPAPWPAACTRSGCRPTTTSSSRSSSSASDLLTAEDLKLEGRPGAAASTERARFSDGMTDVTRGA